jgi:hypothetical protein
MSHSNVDVSTQTLHSLNLKENEIWIAEPNKLVRQQKADSKEEDRGQQNKLNCIRFCTEAANGKRQHKKRASRARQSQFCQWRQGSAL